MTSVIASWRTIVTYTNITGIHPGDAAGLREARIARSTGTLVGLYRADEAGIEDDPRTPWATVCEDHSTVVCHETRTAAGAALAYPGGWCDDCRTKLAGEEAS